MARLADDPCTYRWIVEDDNGDEADEDVRVLGGIALRHGLDDLVPRLGHIGYGIRPSARGRGLATWALGRMLDEARSIGPDRVPLICEDDNIASARTIERDGGVLEGIQDTGHRTLRRYRIGP